MKKRIFTIVTLTLVLIGLIFFVVKVIPKDNNYEGVLVQEQEFRGWQEV